MVIKTFRHKGLKKFFNEGDKSSIQPAIGLILDLLNGAAIPNDVDFPGSEFHPLKGKLKEFYAVKVTANWRIIFKLENGDAYEVDLIDYH